MVTTVKGSTLDTQENGLGINITPYLDAGDTDTVALQNAMNDLGALNTGSPVLDATPFLDLAGKELDITAQVTCPTTRFDLIGGGLAVIKVDSLADSIYPFTGFPRGCTVRDIVIRDTTLAGTKFGWEFKATSALTLENIGAAGLARGYTFDDAHDFRSISGLSTFANVNDVIFDGQTTSGSFESCRFDESTGSCVVVNASLVNMHFSKCGFIMSPTDNNIVNFDIDGQYVIASSIKGCRFEHKGAGTNATHLYMKGVDSSFQMALDVEGNYFTSGDIDQHIHMDGFVEKSPISKNFFNTLPAVADILNTTSNGNLDVTDDNRVDLTRGTAYVIFSDTSSAFYLEHKVKPILIKHDRLSLPATLAGGTGSKSVSVNLTSLTRQPDIEMPTIITDSDIFFRGDVEGAELDGRPLIDTTNNSTVTVEYNVKTAGSGTLGAVEFDLYLWGY